MCPNQGNDDYGIPIHTFAKSKREQIRISINEYQGHEYIDIRVFYLADGEYKPSTKGVTLKKDLYPELLKGVVELGASMGVDPESIRDSDA
jgi:Transcriptional Coactivator p15 (PC4)